MSGDATEAPTPQRLRELRRRGEVPVSAELARAAAALGAAAAIAGTGPAAVAGMVVLARRCFAAGELAPLRGLALAGEVLVRAAAPVLFVAAASAVVAGAAYTGALFAPKRLLPDGARMQLGAAWKARLRPETWATGARALALGAAGAAVGALAVTHAMAQAATAAQAGGVEAVTAAASEPLMLAVTAWLGLAALGGLLDGLWQRASFERQHRMTKQQVRDEYKQSEGDPSHKARRQAAHRELLASDLRRGVAESAVVVRNPTHVAVGLRWDPDTDEAPIVAVRGRGADAKAILREARRRRVPEIIDVRTARAAADLDPGEVIPAELYEPVAIIFRWLRDHGDEDVTSP